MGRKDRRNHVWRTCVVCQDCGKRDCRNRRRTQKSRNACCSPENRACTLLNSTFVVSLFMCYIKRTVVWRNVQDRIIFTEFANDENSACRKLLSCCPALPNALTTLDCALPPPPLLFRSENILNKNRSACQQLDWTTPNDVSVDVRNNFHHTTPTDRCGQCFVFVRRRRNVNIWTHQCRFPIDRLDVTKT